MDELTVTYPRRRLIRGLLRRLVSFAFFVLTDFELVDAANFPKGGPLLVVANHFSYIDPVAVIRVVPWPMEFIGGFHRPNAPALVRWLPLLWGFYPVFRGTGSRSALRIAERVLKQDGVIGVFPEGTSAAAVLRAPRPGAAFLAARTGARLLPIGLDGCVNVFPNLREGRRAKLTVRIGEPFGPFTVPGRGRERRRHLDRISDRIMRRIAALLPPERRGLYSRNPALRREAQALSAYPWDVEPEG